MNWVSQPRGLDGRFQRRGGGDDSDLFMFNGFWKLAWWGKLLFVAAFVGLLAWVYSVGSIFMAMASGLALFLADKALDALIDDDEREDEEEEKE